MGIKVQGTRSMFVQTGSGLGLAIKEISMQLGSTNEAKVLDIATDLLTQLSVWINGQDWSFCSFCSMSSFSFSKSWARCACHSTVKDVGFFSRPHLHSKLEEEIQTRVPVYLPNLHIVLTFPSFIFSFSSQMSALLAYFRPPPDTEVMSFQKILP